MKVKDDLFVLAGGTATATALVTNEGVVLIDDKNPLDFPNLIAALKTVTDQPIKYVVSTHHHPDHVGTNGPQEAAGAVIVGSERTRQNMIELGYPGPPSVTFERDANIILGGKRVELHYFGAAHTGGDIVAYFPQHRVVATGDLYNNNQPQMIDYAAGGSAKAWAKTLDGVLSLDFDIAIAGHGTVGTKDDVRKFRDSTVTLANRVHDMLVSKASREEIEKVMRTEFKWGNLQVNRGLTGIMAEMIHTR